MKKNTSMILLLCLITSMASGCVSKKVDDRYTDFQITYLNYTDFIDQLDSNDVNTVFTNIDEEVLEEGLSELKNDLDYIESAANSETEKELYQGALNYYQEVEFIYYAKIHFNELTEEERDNIRIMMISIEMSRGIFKSETSS